MENHLRKFESFSYEVEHILNFSIKVSIGNIMPTNPKKLEVKLLE